MYRFLRTAVALAVVGLTLAAAASAAQPTREFVSLDDPAIEAEISAFLTAQCGTEIAVDLSGHVIVLVFTDKNGDFVRELDVFEIRGTFTNVETSETTTIVDAGPDIVTLKDDTLFVAITGRSVTGSGVIGRVVVNLETGETVFVAGKRLGDFVENLCAELGS
jgi:hypothetical protein